MSNWFVKIEKSIIDKLQDPKYKTIMVIACLAILYIFWSSTFLAIRISVQHIPPFLLTGSRFMVAGASLYLLMRLSGAPRPGLYGWTSAGAVGILMFLFGEGFVALAQRHVGSGLTAIAAASDSIWVCVVSGLFGRWSSKKEWLGLAVGFAGIILLNFGSEMSADPVNAFLLILSGISWALGSVLTRRLPVPKGLMGAATEMLTGGFVAMAVGIAAGEEFSTILKPAATGSYIYLVLFDAVLGYTAYRYLIHNTRPALATSYAFVTPIGAVLLGVLVAGEKITPMSLVALAVVLTGVYFIYSGREGQRKQETVKKQP